MVLFFNFPQRFLHLLLSYSKWRYVTHTRGNERLENETSFAVKLMARAQQAMNKLRGNQRGNSGLRCPLATHLNNGRAVHQPNQITVKVHCVRKWGPVTFCKKFGTFRWSWTSINLAYSSFCPLLSRKQELLNISNVPLGECPPSPPRTAPPNMKVGNTRQHTYGGTYTCTHTYF